MKKENKKFLLDVSVCLITYNHELYIRQAIESVLMQKNNFSWEIIIADDASTDNTQIIIKDYCVKYPGLFNPILRQKNVGPGLNFFELINSANGKYIAYIEGDDFWTDPLKLQKQFNFMENNLNFSLCYHRVSYEFTFSHEKLSCYESNLDDDAVCTLDTLIEKGWFIKSCSMFFKNIKLPRGFEKLYIGDYPLHILLANMGEIGFLNELSGVYRINNNGLSETTLKNASIKSQLNRILDETKMRIFLIKFINRKFKIKLYIKIIYSFANLAFRAIRYPFKLFLESFT